MGWNGFTLLFVPSLNTMCMFEKNKTKKEIICVKLTQEIVASNIFTAIKTSNQRSPNNEITSYWHFSKCCPTLMV